MRRLFSNLGCNAGAGFFLLCFTAFAHFNDQEAHGSASPLFQRYCQGGKQIRKLSVSFLQKIPPPKRGVPLDTALEQERQWIERLRTGARRYLIDHPPRDLTQLAREHTLLLPRAVREHYEIGSLIGLDSISAALKYKHYLWQQVIETFTTVKEAPSRHPSTLRFEVGLDLSLFCQYGRRVSDLVTH